MHTGKLLRCAPLIFWLAFSVGHAQTITVDKTNRTIAVTVSDTAETTADTATLHLGFLVYGPDSSSAYRKASDTSSAITVALNGFGIEKDQLQSVSQSVSETPQYELQAYACEDRADRLFRAEQSWMVKTKAGWVSKILNVAVAAGANNSGQIDWSVANEDALQTEAATRALERARSIAASMAQGLGARLGLLLYASNTAPSRPPLPFAMGMANGGIAGGAAKAASPLPSPLNIRPARVREEATVYAVFAID